MSQNIITKGRLKDFLRRPLKEQKVIIEAVDRGDISKESARILLNNERLRIKQEILSCEGVSLELAEKVAGIAIDDSKISFIEPGEPWPR